MEISLENVIEKFKLYSGEPLDNSDQRRDALCRELCAGCAQEAGALPWLEDAGETAAGPAESLAAAGAFVQLALLDKAMAPESVSAPELKVALGDNVAYARSLRDEMMRACEGYMSGHSFYFGAV